MILEVVFSSSMSMASLRCSCAESALSADSIAANEQYSDGLLAWHGCPVLLQVYFTYDNSALTRMKSGNSSLIPDYRTVVVIVTAQTRVQGTCYDTDLIIQWQSSRSMAVMSAVNCATGVLSGLPFDRESAS